MVAQAVWGGEVGGSFGKVPTVIFTFTEPPMPHYVDINGVCVSCGKNHLLGE